MANFSTEFPIDLKNSVADVMRLACKWITGSPHSRVPSDKLHELPTNAERVIAVGAEQVSLAHALVGEAELGGLRYEKAEGGLAWTTSIVTLKAPERHILSLQVVCEALNTAVHLPPPKKPHFIRQALTELGGGADGEIPITDQPFRLSPGEEAIAGALILGTANNTLPIVYVSASFAGEHLVNPDELARFVSGMAHVVVEPDRRFSFRVRELTQSRNVYGGTVGVYWPNSEARRAYFFDDELRNARALQLEIAKDIRVALSNRRQRSNCTWSYLKEALSKIRFEQLKAAGSTELQDFIDAFDADIAAKQARVAEAEEEIARLSAEVRRLSSSEQTSRSAVISLGREQDLYESEIRDIIIRALEDAERATRPGSRHQHVLQDLLHANIPSGARENLHEEIKTLLKTYRNMDSKTRSALVRIGFDLSEDGKHYKAVFQGDPRYTFTLPKTSGDHRAGKNMASDINNTLF